MQNRTASAGKRPLASKKPDWSNHSVEREETLSQVPVSHPKQVPKEDPNDVLKLPSDITTPKKGELVGKQKFLAKITNMLSNKKYINVKDNHSLMTKYGSNTLETSKDESLDYSNHRSYINIKPTEKSTEMSLIVNKSLGDEPVTLKKKCQSLANVRANLHDLLTTEKKDGDPDRYGRSNSVVRQLERKYLQSTKSSSAKSRKLMFDVGGKEFALPHSSSRNELTEKTKHDINERKKLHEVYKKQGAERYENRTVRKEMEDQMNQLQNRIKRLQIEQENMKKQLKRTEMITQKTIEAKQRHLNDLVVAESQKLDKLKNEEKMREQIYSEKKEQKENLKNRISTLRGEKVERAKNLKADLQNLEEKKREDRINETGKKIIIHKKTFDLDKKLRDDKNKKEKAHKDKAEQMHASILEIEQKRTSEFQMKIQEMAKVEELLIDQIKTTFQIKECLEDRMKKIAATRVNPHKALEFEQQK